MIIVTTDFVQGREIEETIGVCRGNTVRARNIGRDLLAGLKNIIGGEISEYSKLMTEARDQAAERMEQHAQSLGADAIVNVRFITAEIMQGVAEILVYGTAVRLKP